MPAATETTFKREKLTAHPKVRMRRFLSNWPFFVWLLVIAVTAFLYTRSTQFGYLTGVVETISEPIAPLQTARLKSIQVEMGDRVTNGQIVALMDTTIVDAQLALDKASMTVAEGTLQTYERSMHQLVSQFDSNIRDAEASLMEQKKLQEKDTAEFDALKTIQTERDRLYKLKLISEADANQSKPQIAALEKAVAAYPALISNYEQQLDESKKSRDALLKTLKMGDGKDVSAAIADANNIQRDVLETMIRMREIERDSYALRATRGGIVSQIYSVPGDVVNSGTPMVKIVSEECDEIVGFLPEVHLASLKANDVAYAFRESGRSVAVKLSVESIAPEIDTMPGRINPIQGQALRGRRVVFKIEGEHTFVPGETVQIRMMSSWWNRIRSWLRL